MVGHLLRKGLVWIKHMWGTPRCCPCSHWTFICDTLNPERETTPAIMTLVKKHWILNSKASGKLECLPKILGTHLARSLLFDLRLPYLANEIIGRLSELQIYLPALFGLTSVHFMAVCLLCTPGPLSCRSGRALHSSPRSGNSVG